jgi:hypothetical protein
VWLPELLGECTDPVETHVSLAQRKLYHIEGNLKSAMWFSIDFGRLDSDPDPGGHNYNWPTKIVKNEEISCFPVLDVLLRAFPVDWTSLVEA